jgi:hypothetical protein
MPRWPLFGSAVERLNKHSPRKLGALPEDFVYQLTMPNVAASYPGEIAFIADGPGENFSHCRKKSRRLRK